MEHRKAQKTVREHLLKNRTRQLPKRATRPIKVHDWVLVHHRRFLGHSRNKLQERWLGPFLVTKANFNTVEVKVTPRMGRTATVSQQDCRRWPGEACEPEVYETIDETDQIIEEGDVPETMKDVEAEGLGYYEVDRIHEHRYRRGWQFRTTWKGYPDETWEPIRNFVLAGNRRLGPLSTAFLDYCNQNDLQQCIQAGLQLAKQ